MVSRHRNRGISFAILLGCFVRELLAVTLYLLLEWRAHAYDFFTPALVLFVVLITLRTPYLNAYTFLLEMFGMSDWELSHHVGMHGDSLYNLLRTLAVLTAHVGGAVAAAALRVYWDVTYGKESSSGGRPGFQPSLSVDPSMLSSLDSFWNADDRLARIGNVTEALIPLGPEEYLGIGQVPLMAWYVLEDAGYVCMVCIITIHIWLYTGLGEGKPHTNQNPFYQRYWVSLFTLCMLLSLVNTALYRAFPTAHGSLHNTIFKWQYQSWNPSVRLVDNQNSEVFSRIIGGLLGLLLASGYNRLLVSTEKDRDDDNSGDFWFKIVWGFEPDQLHTREKRINGDSGERRSSYTRKDADSCVVIKLPGHMKEARS